MNLKHLYWVVITLLGTIHLQALFLATSMNIPFYFTFLIVIAVVYFLTKKIPVHFVRILDKWNLLFVMQVLIVLNYLVQPSWIPFSLFIGLEGLRIVWNDQISTFQTIKTV